MVRVELAYLREKSPTMHRELVPPASPRQQLKACYQSMRQMRDYAEPKKSEHEKAISAYQDLLVGILSSPTLSDNAEVAQRQ